MTSRPGAPSTGRSDLSFYGLSLLAVALLYIFLYADMPIYGDARGYGHICANCFADNGMPFVATGSARGVTAGGHVTAFF